MEIGVWIEGQKGGEGSAGKRGVCCCALVVLFWGACVFVPFLVVVVFVVIVLVLLHGGLWTGCRDVLCSLYVHSRSGLRWQLCSALLCLSLRFGGG